MTTVAQVLDSMTHEGVLYEDAGKQSVRCFACSHRCLIHEGRRGICQVRFNRDGKLFVPWGYVAALQADPIEKKPFFHMLPGSDALTFGMLGCDFHCEFCQNYISSQTLRDPASDISISMVRKTSPEQIVALAQRANTQVIASSYNEPLITTEWAVDIFRLAVEAGIKCVYVSNGNATPEALDYLHPLLSAYKIDLKTMQDRQYRQLGGVLQNVLDTIRNAHELGLWVEEVTLVIPGFNDSSEELMDAACYVASVSRDIPWHVTAFHPDYKMTDNVSTSQRTLIRAAEIGQEAGLNYVYAGNIPGRVGEYESTYCPNCRTRVIERSSFAIRNYSLTADGKCPKCGTQIPGIWPSEPAQVKLHGHGFPRPVY